MSRWQESKAGSPGQQFIKVDARAGVPVACAASSMAYFSMRPRMTRWGLVRDEGVLKWAILALSWRMVPVSCMRAGSGL
jgi:hypothetical protein